MTKANDSYDAIVIGGGPAGYVFAIRAAQLGLSVALVEKQPSLGGTCLNVGCIPSKALLTATHHLHDLQHNFAEFGITAKSISCDLKAMLAHKDRVVGKNTKGIDFLMKKNKIARFQGMASFVSGTEISVDMGGESKRLKAAKIVIATGSSVTPLKGVEIDEEMILSSTGALSMSQIPKSLVIIGAGVIGLELGSVWQRLGSEIMVIEYLDRILPTNDKEISNAMQKILEGQGFQFRLGTKVTSVQKKNKAVTLKLETSDGKNDEIKADAVLVAIGRKPNTEGLGAETIGIALDKRGFIQVNQNYQTNIPTVFAIGDVVGGMMLAHKAEEEAVALAEQLVGQHGHVNYAAIPSIIYTWPEVASVGATEEELQQQGLKYKVGKFSFMANGRAVSMNETTGFVKILADETTDRLLGAHIIGASAGDLIAELVLALEFGASSEDISRISHAHPTLSEVVKEACLAVAGRALHS